MLKAEGALRPQKGVDMDTEQIFENLCENALDFLDKSICDLDEEPKYALVHFSSAVELILKARLLKEHWSLIVDKNPDLEKFKRGDLRSVSHLEAMNRLSKIVNDPVGINAKQSFETVVKHRNRVVHFYHSDEQKNTEEFKVVVATDLCLALYHLQQTLNKWSEYFLKFEDKFFTAFSKAKRIRKFLEVKFKELETEIIRRANLDEKVRNCNHCSFQSVFTYKVSSMVFEARCLVCGLEENEVSLDCPECGKDHKITAYDCFQEINCKCGYLIEQTDFQDIAGSNLRYDKDSEPLVNCGECGCQYIAVCHEGMFLCTECISFSDVAGLCNWCNERELGFYDSEYSYVTGCSFCEGQIGWTAND